MFQFLKFQGYKSGIGKIPEYIGNPIKDLVRKKANPDDKKDIFKFCVYIFKIKLTIIVYQTHSKCCF